MSFNFEVDTTNVIEPGFKYTFELTNYIFNMEADEEYNEDSKLVIKLKPEKCDDVYQIDSSDSSDDAVVVTDGNVRLRRRYRRRLNSNDSDSNDRNEIGVSSDDSNDFDLDTLVFRNTPNATVQCGNGEELSEEVVNVQMCYDDDNIILAFDSFGNPNEICNIIQDPFALIDSLVSTQLIII